MSNQWNGPSNNNSSQVGTRVPTEIPSGFGASTNALVPGLTGHPVTAAAAPGLRLTPAGGDPGALSPSTATMPGAQLTFSQGLHHLLMLGVNDPGALQQTQEKLIRAGLLNPQDTSFVAGSVSSTDATYYAYAELMDQAIQTHTSIDQILSKRISNPHNTTGKRFWQEYHQQQQANGGPITKSFTTTQVSLTDAPDAAAVARNQYESLLGREATPEEAQAFYGALTAYEQAHPSVTSGTEKYDPTTGQSTVKNETTSGGINEAGAGELAANAITAGHGTELAKTQGDQLYDLFASLLGGTA